MSSIAEAGTDGQHPGELDGGYVSHVLQSCAAVDQDVVVVPLYVLPHGPEKSAVSLSWVSKSSQSREQTAVERSMVFRRRAEKEVEASRPGGIDDSSETAWRSCCAVLRVPVIVGRRWTRPWPMHSR